MWGKNNKTKYKSVRVDFDGHSFASQLEAALYNILKLEKLAGIWSDLACQVQVRLGPAKILYKPDFKMIDAQTGRTVYAEAKGLETASWRLKRRLWIAHETHELRIYKGTARRIVLTETIHSGGFIECAKNK